MNARSAGRKAQRPREVRHDVLTYTSPVLSEDLTVIGPLTAVVYLRSSCEHTDLFVRLCDVDAKGRSFNLSDGVVRLAPGSVSKDDDGVCMLEIAMWPTANTFLAGHRLRLQVSSGAHPLFARNTGTGEPLATGTGLQAADQEIFHDSAHPSHVGAGGAPPGRRAHRRAPSWRSPGPTSRCTSAPPAPSASVPRITQPTFVPIAEADQVRPARHLHVPGSSTATLPAEVTVPAAPKGRSLGTPGPDSGFALRLAKRFEHDLRLGEGESEHDVVLGVALVAVKRAALFGGAPWSTTSVSPSTYWQFLADAPADVRAVQARALLLGVTRLRGSARPGRLGARGGDALDRGASRRRRCERPAEAEPTDG